MKRMLLLIAIFALMLPVSALPTHAEAHAESPVNVVINEIFPDPKGPDLSAEFIEVMNRGDSDTDISGWYVTDQDGSVDFTFPNMTLKSGEIAVVYVGNSSFRWSGGYEFFMNRSTSMLNNGGDDVSLFDSSDNLIDYVSYGNGSMVDPPEDGEWQSAPDSVEGLSIARNASGEWCLSMPTPGIPNPDDNSSSLSISAIYPVARYSDEFFAIHNSGRDVANIFGYMVTDGEGYLYFPPDTLIGPGKTLYVSQNASGFLAEMGHMPDIDYSECYTPSFFPQLSNSGDSLELISPEGRNLSMISYGVSIPVPPKGYYLWLYRDTWVDTRVGCSDVPPFRMNFSGEAVVYSSPENSFESIAGFVDSARYSIIINTYSFDDIQLAEHLAYCEKKGVRVRLLVEGRPVSGIDDSERRALDVIASSGGDVIIKNGTQRYRYDHAKYMVIDGTWALIQSENLNPDALRENHTWGNRGWGIALKSPELSAYLRSLFINDTNLNFSDMERYTVSGQSSPAPITIFPRPGPSNFSGNLTVLVGPEHGLNEVIKAIDSAKRSVYVEQFYITHEWGKEENPLIDALLSAARRGCDVKVLLDGEFYNTCGEDDNDEIAASLNNIAGAEGLHMQARVIDSSAHHLTKVHNKGMIIDGKEVLVSSFNWGMNSFTNNREMAVLIENSSIAQYYLSLFNEDWKQDFCPPTAMISGKTGIFVNESALYTSLSTDDRGIVSQSWYLDGEELSENSSIALNFSEPGNHTLTLKVSDYEGNLNTTSMDITVMKIPPLTRIKKGSTGAFPLKEPVSPSEDIPSGDNESHEERRAPSPGHIYYLLIVPAALILAAASRISREKGQS